VGISKTKWAGGLAAGFGGLLVLLLALPALVPGAYWGKALTAAAAAGGQELTLDEAPSLRLFPSPRLTTGGFAVADGGQVWLQGSSLAVRIETAPLLSGRVEVAHFEAVDPVVQLAALPTGAESTEPQPPTDGEGPALPALQDVRIRGGKILDGDATLVEAADLDLSWPGPDKPVEVSGTVTFDGEAVSLDGWIERPLDFAEGKASKLDLQLGLPGGGARLSGAAVLGKAGTFDGSIKLNAGDLRGLLGWLGIDLGEGEGFQLADLAGRVQRRGDTWSLTGVDFNLDRQPLAGDIELRLSNPPRILATLRGSAELDRWLGAGPPLQAAPKTEARNPKTRNPNDRRPQDSGGWSQEPLDFSALKAVQGRLDLTLEAGSWGALPMAGTLVATLKAGRLHANLNFNQPRQPGRPRGSIEAVVRSGKTPSITTKGTVSSGDLGIQLAQLVGVERLTGAGSLTWDLASSGTTAAELVSAASGTGSIRLSDGGLKKLDLLELVTSLFAATDSEAWAAATTPFEDARADFALKRGQLTVSDLLLKTQPARLTGGGTIDLTGRRVALDLNARLGLAARRGVRVPLVVQGDFSALTWTPDAAGLLGGSLGERLNEALGTPGFRPR